MSTPIHTGRQPLPTGDRPMTTLTPEDRARLRDLAAKATPGPWRADECLPASPGEFAVVTPREENAPYADQPAQYVTPWGLTGTDAALIAAMRTAVPALLDEAERAETERDRLHSQADHWRLRAEQAEAALRSIPGYTTPEHFRGAVEALIREENAAEAARDTAERQVKAVRDACDGMEKYGDMGEPHASRAARVIRRALDGEAGR